MDETTLNQIEIWSVFATGLGTIVLGVVAIWAGFAARGQLKLAKSKHRLATLTAVQRFLDVRKKQVVIIKEELRIFDDARKQEAEQIGAPAPANAKIPELFMREPILARVTSTRAKDALQACLDPLERIAIACNAGLYDKDLVYKAYRTPLHQIVEWSRDYIDLMQKGELPGVPVQPLAYCELLKLDESLQNMLRFDKSQFKNDESAQQPASTEDTEAAMIPRPNDSGLGSA